MDRSILAAIAAGRAIENFTRPTWWPDDVDRPHLAHWIAQADQPNYRVDGWGPRALVLDDAMIGHAGFHGPPVSINAALSDPTFTGNTEPATNLAVEVGYTVFPQYRSNGFATEALLGLIGWAESQADVSTVIATVETTNRASTAVLERAGRFRNIGTCRGEHGETEDVYRRDLF